MRLFDVLSIVVGSYDHDEPPFERYGRVEVDDILDKFCIFERDENNFEIVSPSRSTATASLSLADPKCSFFGGEFHVDVDLKDVGGRVVSKGDLLMNLFCSSIYDMPMCSVIGGDHGYAALHYIIHYDTLEATELMVSFYYDNNDTDGSANVCGKLVAYSSNMETLLGMRGNIIEPYFSTNIPEILCNSLLVLKCHS